ncbi:MAG: PfkB family carbohydrate kinase [Candidatus Sulfotelmatobacter sp.]
MNSPRVLFLGRSTLDALYRLDGLPAEDTKVYAREFHAAPGGPALNAAITHALLGGEAMLISTVGGGPWAGVVRAELKRHGVRLLDLAAGTDYETPLTTVLVNAASGSRTILNPPLSAVQLTPLAGSWEKSVPADWGAVPPVVLTDGFHLDQTLALLADCKAAGAAICLDGGSWKPGTAEVAPLLSVAICSERFAVPGIDADMESLFAWLADRGVACIALTRGAKPILGWERGRRFEIEVEQIYAADTLGAGDVLHGAFAHYFACGMEFEPALRRAAQIASLSCRSLGTGGWAAGDVHN